MKYPSEKIWAADANRLTKGPNGTDNSWKWQFLEPDFIAKDNPNTNWNTLDYRHNRRANVLFLDGHVEPADVTQQITNRTHPGLGEALATAHPADQVAGECMSSARPPMNILLITSDQQHYSTLGVTNRTIRTPALDRLAAEGTRFNRVYCNNPLCSPSRATIITGLYPSVAQVRWKWNSTSPTSSPYSTAT